MAIYHFSAKVISRASGSSAVASAAYRSASRLYDERIDRDHDFSNKTGVVHSEVMLPDGAAEHLGDRSTLWNAVEAGEVRRDAQLAREIEFAIPRELVQADGIALAREFVAEEFAARGMVADLNVHWDMGADGEPKPHAHVMLTMREVGEDGFGAKVRDWNRTGLLEHWRGAWATYVNTRMAELGIEARIDHRSFEAQGIDLEPQHKIGPAGSRRLERGEDAERAADHVEIARRNGEAIVARPEIGLDAITRQQSTFTVRDMARMAHRHSDGKEQFDQVLGAMRGADQLVSLGRDGASQDRFTTRGMIEVELKLARSAEALERSGHIVAERHVERALASASNAGLILSSEQRAALRHVTATRDLGLVIGYAGSGKSAMLGVAREAWEAQGYTVRGAALSGIAAENLEQGSGIASRTIASLEHQWARGRDQLSAGDVKDGENCYASFEHRSRTLGHRCIYLNPFDLLGLMNTRINPLQTLIDIVARGEQIDTEADEIAHILLPSSPKSKDGDWVGKGARRMLAVRMEYLALFEPELCTLSGLWRFVNSSKSDMDMGFAMMATCGLAGLEGKASALRATADDAPKQFEAWKSDCIEALHPFEPGKTLDRATSGHDFDFKALKHAPHTVYLMAPSEKLAVAAPWISLIVSHIIETVAREPGPVRTTFLLDEFPMLPPSPSITKTLRLYRGKGLQLWIFSQGRYSLEERWSREAVKEFEDMAAIFNTSAVEDPDLMGDIEKWSGNRTVLMHGVNRSGGTVESAGANLGEARRAVLQSEDIRSIGAGRQIVRVAGLAHLLVCDRVHFDDVAPWKSQLRDVRDLHRGINP